MVSSSSAPPPIVVIGAGIVGACTAAYLAREGAPTTLIDPGEPGMGASFGNGACLFGSSIVPVSMPGTAWSVPRYLLDPEGPLAIRMRYLPRLAPWLWRFSRAGTVTRSEAAARALRALLLDAHEDYAPIVADTQAQDLVQRRGHLVVYETEESFRADGASMALRERNGVQIEELGPAQLREMEPELAPNYVKARLIRESGHTTNPLRLVQALTASVQRQGGRVFREKVVGFEDNGSRVTAVATERGRHPASHVVLAAGAWSGMLAAQLGDRVPLETERGYHAMIRDPERKPRLPVMSGEGKFIAITLETGIRFAGQVELASLEAAPDWNRARILLRLGLRMFPGLGARDLEARLTTWLGFRPSLPDSLPVIGPSSRFRNAFHAFGHGHVGLCAGASTGRAVADLIAGRVPRIDLEPFRPTRFN
ncbi:MAG: FAD-binding oxidoreductase [Burkholderiaceae bacterium]|nr:FAD-binding oxidoreductase [Burkholderiaceae bacterium]